ncbi:hypothetical protein [Streptomyces roseifaciens]|uniref:hypothetical protein n=1 Tax=Streptomyces roseifaciens TaxID=1488406 RepID=UPI0007182B1F|nr:hypothetical protein [Streptomyces roseifaciens]
MSDADLRNTLVVPVELDALVVRAHERRTDGFRRWKANHHLLRVHHSPEPEPFGSEDPGTWTGIDPEGGSEDGVYLQWRLPRALLRGVQDPATGRMDFPLVPNRWLVVRHIDDRDGKRAATAWVVESDYLNAEHGTSSFIHPYGVRDVDPGRTPFRTRLTVTRIGRRTLLRPGVPWREPALTEDSRKEQFLTAMGPGLLAFHLYQPYNQDVFSLHDPLPGIGKATVGYLVMGWYSNPAQDILKAGGRPLEKTLAGLGWTTPDAKGRTVGRSAYCGRTHALTWHRDGTTPHDSNRPEPTGIRVAVGNSTADAFTALVRQATKEKPFPDMDPGVLDAVQHGLLNTLDGTDGEADTDETLHRSWFRAHPGGYTWRLTDAAGGALGRPGTSETERTARAYLRSLNQAQDKYDEAHREQTALQQKLYAQWWLHGLPSLPPICDRAALAAELNPGNPASLAAEVGKRKRDLAKLHAALPTGDTPAAWLASVKKLAPHVDWKTYRIRRDERPAFQQPADPTVVLSGANSRKAAEPMVPPTLACRFADQILGGLHVGKKRYTPAHVPPVELRGLPPVAAQLLTEAFLLDPANARRIATELGGGTTEAEVKKAMAAPKPLKDTQKPPSLLPGPWRQPWLPLYFQWQVTHYTVPFGPLGKSHWTFDGTTWEWTTDPGGKRLVQQISGRQFLTPLPQYNLGERVREHARHRPKATAESLEKFAGRLTELDLLAQRLDGFTDRLAGRDYGTNVAPPGPIGELVGDAYHFLPDPGPRPDPFEDPKTMRTRFPQIRAGQFHFTRLSIVDRFGHCVDVLLQGDQRDFVPYPSPALTRGTLSAVGKTFPERLVQLPPRLLQPARLGFDYLTDGDDTLPADPNHTPVCAWIIPNYLDKTLLCYDPHGLTLGELRLRDVQGRTRVVWNQLPDTPHRTPDSLKDKHPALHRFATRLIALGQDAFLDLLAAVDQTMTHIDPANPYGGQVLGTLLGRPLALVRTRLRLDLDGPPLRDPHWKYAPDWKSVVHWRTSPTPEAHAHTTYPWPIRLGHADKLGDGLVGYFTENDYDTFHPVVKPTETRSRTYLAAIDATTWPRLPADSRTRAHLTLLMDPQAAVHAFTDLLPVGSIRLRPDHVQPALAAMTLALRLGPVLAPLRPSRTRPAQVPASVGTEVHGAGAGAGAGTGTGPETGLVLPRPPAAHGTWDWAQRTPRDGWEHLPLVAADTTAHLDHQPAVVRSGMLRLRGSLAPKENPR